MENKNSIKSTLIVLLILNLLLNIFLLLVFHRTTGFPFIIDISKVYQNFGDITIVLVIIQLFLNLVIFLTLRERIRERNERIGKIGVFLWFLACFTIVNNPLVNIGLIIATIRNLETFKQKDENQDKNISNNTIKKDSDLDLKSNVFERIINNFLIRPLLYKKYENYFRNTKLGRGFTLLYIIIYITIFIFVIVAPFSDYDNIITYKIDKNYNNRIIDSVTRVRDDIMNGTTIDEVERTYPEVLNMNKNLFVNFYNDFISGSGTEDLIKKYPELFTEQEQIDAQNTKNNDNENTVQDILNNLANTNYTNINKSFYKEKYIKIENYDIIYFHIFLIIAFMLFFRIILPSTIHLIFALYNYVSKGNLS